MKKLILFLASITLSGGLAIAQDEPSAVETAGVETSPGARIASYSKIGRVIVDGQQVHISKGLTDIIMEEGAADLEDDSRIQCQHVKRTGSHITMRVCRTIAELEEIQEFNRDEFDRRYLRQRSDIGVGGTLRRNEPARGQ